jgi:DNA-directed RNA polymerase subunit RPC12/RpoP
MNSKIIGIIFIVVGVLVFLGGAAVSFSATGVTTGGAVLGTILSLFVAIPAVAGGIFLTLRGKSDANRQVDAARQRQILDMVKTRGSVNVSDLVIELNSSSEQVRSDIYKLVGMGLFTGYVNWDKGMLYSKEASQMTAGNSCPNCGGEISLGGKGVVTCQYCGAEVFL